MLPLHLERRVSKRITHRYCGSEFSFPLTHALFSSAAVDTGSNQLLVLLAREFRSQRFSRVVDIGCGTGVLGIALSKAYGARLEATDRDLLAVEWTAAVADMHAVEAAVSASVMPVHIQPSRNTLVVSNLPAKAGAPVLETMFSRIVQLISADGSVGAVVVVEPLRDWLSERILATGVSLVTERRSKNHFSVAFSVGDSGKDENTHGLESPLDPSFFRKHGLAFTGPADEYRMDTVYSLPEFDQLSFRLALLFDLLTGLTLNGTVLVRGLRQGHAAVGVSQKCSPSSRLFTSDRDVLADATTAHNLERLGFHATSLPASTVATIPTGEKFDWVIVDETPEPGTPWEAELVDFCRGSVIPGGKLIVAGGSTTVRRAEKALSNDFRVRADRKMHGTRAALFVRKR